FHLSDKNTRNRGADRMRQMTQGTKCLEGATESVVNSARPAAIALALLTLLLVMSLTGCGLTNSGAKQVPASVAQLKIATPALPAAQMQGSYQASLAASGGKSPYTWSVASGALPAGLALTSATGTISGKPSQAGAFSFAVQVQDSSSPLQTASAPLTLDVSAASTALQITTAGLANGRVQSSYQASLAASGGTAPYSWKIASGALAAGLSLSASAGSLSGTPTQTGTFNVTFAVRDSSRTAQSATKSLSLVISVASAPASLQITTSGLPSGVSSRTYSATLTAANGVAPYTWSFASNSGPLPQGLSLSATTGNITGTPSQHGQFNFVAKVTDNSSPAQSATAALTIDIFGGGLDQYGGRTDVPCPTNGNGGWTTQKLGNRWWFCTPSGNAFFLLAVDVVDETGGPGYPAAVNAKYGGSPTWAAETDQRLLSWGFNGLGTYANAYTLPYVLDSSFPLDANGLHSQPVKLPFIGLVRPGFYSMENPAIFASDFTNKKLLTDQVKSIFYGSSIYYTGFQPGHGSADYFDPKIDTWLAADLANEMSLHNLKNSPYQNYMIGMACDDSDQTFGFGAGPDFPTVPPGHNNAHLGWITATTSPTQTASSQYSAVYIDTILHTKKAWHDMLASKYGTISALNAAWGSNYTTFDSSGKQITAEAVGTGTGSRLSFTHRLANLTPSKFSVQILVNGTPVAGDIGNGTIYGPDLTAGTISYATGATSITFASGKAPSSGAAITVNYMQNGWGIGSGLMDEDGHPIHQAWLGSDFVYLTNTNPSVKTDFDTFLGQIATQFFGTCRKEIKAAFPNTLFLGPDSLTAWGAPSPAPVLQAAGQYIDAFIASATTQYPQAEMDFIAKNYGDKPYIATQFRTANADSAMSIYPDSGQFITQQARGLDYYNNVTSLQSLATSAG